MTRLDHLSLFSSSLVVCFVFSKAIAALVVPESTSFHLVPRIEAAPVGPGLINDLTLSTGVSLGCVAAVYVGVLAIIGVVIASLSPSRNRALVNGVEEAQVVAAAAATAKVAQQNAAPLRSPAIKSPTARNFSYPKPPPESHAPNTPHNHHLSLSSVCLTPSSDPLAERQEVMDSRNQAHEQLADLYKLVLQQDEQRAASNAGSPQNSPGPAATFARNEELPGKRTKSKPANLSLDKTDHSDKRKSRGSALLSALLSPKRKSKGLSISSPLMTPMSAAITQHETQEMHPLSPRHYIPMPPPPVPTGIGAGMEHYAPDSPRTIDGRMALPRLAPRASKSSFAPPNTQGEEYPDEQYQPHYHHHHHHHQDSRHHDDQEDYHREEYHHQEEYDDAEEHPEEEPTSIEGRLGLSEAKPRASGPHGRRPADIDISPISIESQHSQVPLVGLPQSPKPQSVRFSGLPQSPKPGATFQSQISTPRTAQSLHNTAVRANGALALRAYESSGEAVTNLQFKQTVFERTGMLSPTSPGAAVPYTPYQPFTPCIPMTPSLVTKQDRKRMKKMEPKTPTVEMVQASEDIW